MAKANKILDPKATESILDDAIALYKQRNVIHSIVHEFSNGKYNILKDKINEIIKHIS